MADPTYPILAELQDAGIVLPVRCTPAEWPYRVPLYNAKGEVFAYCNSWKGASVIVRALNAAGEASDG